MWSSAEHGEKITSFLSSNRNTFFVHCLFILFLLAILLVAESQEICFCAQLFASWIAGSLKLNKYTTAVHVDH